jgi:hypothetical protein
LSKKNQDNAMSDSISIHQDSESGKTLTEEERRLCRERIRQQSRVVDAFIAATPDARAFYDETGSPRREL